MVPGAPTDTKLCCCSSPLHTECCGTVCPPHPWVSQPQIQPTLDLHKTHRNGGQIVLNSQNSSCKGTWWNTIGLVSHIRDTLIFWTKFKISFSRKTSELGRWKTWVLILKLAFSSPVILGKSMNIVWEMAPAPAWLPSTSTDDQLYSEYQGCAVSNVHFPSLCLRAAPSIQLPILPLLTQVSSPWLTSVMFLLSRPCHHQADQPWLSHLSPSAASSPFADSSSHLTKVFPGSCPSLFLLLHLRLPQTDFQLGCLIPSPSPASLNPKSSVPSPHPSNSLGKLSSQLREPCIHQFMQHSVPWTMVSMNCARPWFLQHRGLQLLSPRCPPSLSCSSSAHLEIQAGLQVLDSSFFTSPWVIASLTSVFWYQLSAETA